MSPDPLQTRIDDLEATVAFQERTLAQLDEVVQAFTRRIETLEAELLQVRSRLPQGLEVGPHDDPPPHY